MDVLSILGSSLLGTATGEIGAKLLADLIRRVSEQEQDASERLDQARREYQESILNVDIATSPLEQTRKNLLASLTELQAEVMLTVTSTALLIRLLPLLYEQTIETYEARTEQDLKFVELGLGQIKGTLGQYKRMLKHRRWARTGAIIVTLIALFGLVVLIFFGTQPGGPNVDYVLPVISVPLPILIWSAIGSFTAMLYRFNQSGDIELQDPLRWLFTRPITGVVMGVIAYFVLMVGFLSVDLETAEQLGSSEVMWLVAFIAGFSDRFADNILKTLVGRFGGDPNDELVTMQTMPSFSFQSIDSAIKSLPIIGDMTQQRREQRNRSVASAESSQSTPESQSQEFAEEIFPQGFESGAEESQNTERNKENTISRNESEQNIDEK